MINQEYFTSSLARAQEAWNGFEGMEKLVRFRRTEIGGRKNQPQFFLTFWDILNHEKAKQVSGPGQGSVGTMRPRSFQAVSRSGGRPLSRKGASPHAALTPGPDRKLIFNVFSEQSS